MTKKSLTLLLSMLMVLSFVLAACSGGGNAGGNEGGGNGQAGNSGNQGGTNAGSGDGGASEEPAEFTIMLPLNVADQPTDIIKNELEKLTNTKLTYNFFPADTYEEKLNTSFATGSLPEVDVYEKPGDVHSNERSDSRRTVLGDRAATCLNFRILSKLKPQILRQHESGRQTVFALYRPATRPPRPDLSSRIGRIISVWSHRKMSMNCSQWRAFTEDDPDGDGQNNTIGLDGSQRPHLWRVQNGRILVRRRRTTGARRTASCCRNLCSRNISKRWISLRKIRDEGYMNNDFAATSKTDQTNLFYNGTAGMYIGSHARR